MEKFDINIKKLKEDIKRLKIELDRINRTILEVQLRISSILKDNERERINTPPSHRIEGA